MAVTSVCEPVRGFPGAGLRGIRGVPFSPETRSRDKAMQKINDIARGMDLEQGALEQIKKEFGIHVPQDYMILGIDPQTKLEEIKKVYHTLALQFHPDNATHLSETQREASEEAFRRIKTAYERILKQYRID